MVNILLGAPTLEKNIKHTSGINVLIVEDDVDTAETLWVTLLFEGYGVRVTRCRDDALHVLQNNIYHIIVLDYFMPGLGAEEFLKLVRTRSPLSKVILVSAANQVRGLANKLGLENWIAKPVHPEKLIEMLEDLS